MDTSWPLVNLLSGLSEENYDNKFSAYRFWIELGAAHGGVSNDQLYNDILSGASSMSNTITLMWTDIFYNGLSQYTGTGQLIHSDVHLLLRFITDAELDPALSTYAIGLHDRLRRKSLEQFFRESLNHVSGGEPNVSDFYTRVNLIAHWVNLGYVSLEDIRDHILQSLIFLHPTVHSYQLNSLMILLKISGATFAAYVDPSVMDRCCDLLERSNLSDKKVLIELAEEVLRLRESGWEGLPPPPILRSTKPKVTVPKSKDPAATPVATSLGLPGMGEQSRPPTLPSPAPDTLSSRSTSPKSSAPPSPSTSITALSDFTIADSLDDELILEPETITPHGTFYLEDGSVEVMCGKTLFRVHTSTLSFHSPVLRQMFSPANLASAESPNGCPRIASSDPPADFATLLKVVYLPEFQDRTKIPDFSTFSSLLRVSANHEMPNLRARLLGTIRDAYPENFEGLDPSKVLGENVFDGPKPHPNAVLNLFVQQRVTSALRMAYYMAARRGLGSLMDTRLPSNSTLSGRTLGSAISGLMGLREMELKEAHRIVFAMKDASNRVGCTSIHCPSHPKAPLSTEIIGAYQRTFDRITGSADGGTRVLQVLSTSEFAEDTESRFCKVCREKVQAAHAEVRKKAWVALPEMFGLKG